jgi:class 3 adenylate cyclase
MLRVGVPILGVALVIVAILGITLYSHTANRNGVLALSNHLLDKTDAQIAQQVASFIAPGERALRIMQHMAHVTPPADRYVVTERYAISVLKEVPQISAFYIGDGSGAFAMVRRQGEGLSVKEIVNDRSGRHVFLIERNAANEEISRREDPADLYDPRTRPWFVGAQGTEDIYWTGVYTFFTDRKPGITASIRVPELIQSDAVLGVDITLDELSGFLSTLEVGEGGRVIIMDAEGRVIAVPNSQDVSKQSGSEFIPISVDELGDAVLTAAYDRFRIEGKGSRLIELKDENYISSATQLSGGVSNWWILIAVPESDFVGFVASNHKNALVMSLVIVAAVVVLAVLLVRQGLQSDRTIRRVSDQERRIARQSAAYNAIADEIAAHPGETPRALTQELAEVTGAKRVSIWRFANGKQTLSCSDSYDQDRRAHTGGFELHRREMPAFFDLLEAGREESVINAGADRRCAQFHTSIMRSLGSNALTLMPLRRADEVTGAICLEDPGPMDDSKEFLRTSGALLLSTMKSTEIKIREDIPGRGSRKSSPVEIKPISSTDLGPTAEERLSLRSDYFSKVAVMALSMSGALGLAKKCRGAEDGMAVQISECLQDMAAQHGITYLKVAGRYVTAAAGFDRDDTEAMTSVAELAVAVRDRLSQLMDGGDATEFRIGLAFGGCYGCLLGRERHQFNLWGEAFDTAETMAQSAPSGAIQASSAAYAQLHHDFLFRPRGNFYQPRLGEMRCYVLAGQL